MGWHIKFNHMGEVIFKEQMAKQDGTCVIVKDLFKDIHVRLLEYKKTYKTQYAKALSHLQSYAYISTKTRISVAYSIGDSP